MHAADNFTPIGSSLSPDRGQVNTGDRPVRCAGNAHSEASAYVRCYSEIIAETFAFAAARASAAAGCYYGYQDADVRTEIEATVDALVNNYETCTIIEHKEGLGDSSGNGGTTSGSVRPPPRFTTAARRAPHFAYVNDPEVSDAQPYPQPS